MRFSAPPSTSASGRSDDAGLCEQEEIVTGTNTTHRQELRQVAATILAASPLQERDVEAGSGRVHLVEAGSGPAVVVADFLG